MSRAKASPPSGVTAASARLLACSGFRQAAVAGLLGCIAAASGTPAYACITAESHDYLFHSTEPKRLPEDDLVVEVVPDFSVFKPLSAGDFSARTYDLKVKRILSGTYDEDVVRVQWARTSCSYLGASDTARFLVGKLITVDGQTVLEARSWSPSEMSEMSLLRDMIVRDAIALTLPAPD